VLRSRFECLLTFLNDPAVGGCDEATHDALRGLRREVARRVARSLPPGWIITEVRRCRTFKPVQP
jgi:hypothetical protein